MLSEKGCNQLIQRYASYNPVYIWGANWGRVITESASSLFRLYGSSTGKYNQEYYNKKVQQAINQSQGYASDCSGFFYGLAIDSNGNKIDRTAQGYYDHCTSKGDISSIDLSHSCVVFRGSPSKITHIGFYSNDGFTYEMANSEDNFRKQPFNARNWTYWGRPEFIDYSVVDTPTVSGTKQYLHKGIDISTYQKNVNYKLVKEDGVEFAILKIIRKDLNPDNQFETHYAGCIANGIPVSCYNYSYATTIEQARQAANAVLNTLNGRKIPVYMDVEDNCLKGLGSYLAEIINAYQEVIERAGLAFGVYTGMAFYSSYLASYRSQIKCMNWHIARYYKGYTEMPFDEDPDETYKPSMLTTSWQYTSSGKVKGIDGRVDLDVMYSLPKPPSVEDAIIPSPVIPTVELNPTIRNIVSTNGKNLNVRNKPSVEIGKVVKKLPNKAEIIIFGTDKTGKWARLSVTENLWCSLTYISATGCGKVTAEKSLYVRSSDSTSGEVWGVYKSGEVVTILHQSTNTGWYLTVGTSKDGTQVGGWCSNKYITTT